MGQLFAENFALVGTRQNDGLTIALDLKQRFYGFLIPVLTDR